MADFHAYWLREMSEQRTAIHLDTLREAADKIQRLQEGRYDLVENGKRQQAEIERLRQLIVEWSDATVEHQNPPGKAPFGSASLRRMSVHQAELALIEEARRG